MNRLLFGDNLGWLRDAREFPDASVDLEYLAPPFNSNADYNVLFREASGEASQAQFHAFTDSWSWADAAELYNQFIDTCPNVAVTEIMEAFHSFLKNSPMMAYLAMMAPRLVELHRVLKPTGSLYLHCDPTASHYLKLLLDAIFGAQNFRNEIIWKRVTSHSDAKRWSPIADTIFYYAKSETFIWNPQFMGHDDDYVADKYRFDDHDGRGAYRLGDMTSPSPRPNMMYEWKGHKSPTKGWRFSKETMQELDAEGRICYPDSKDKRPQLKRYLEEMSGHLISSLWDDIPPINSMAKERLGYPTQKPVALLERIINASSNPGDVVLDPFGGCGTTVHAAQKTGRQWIAIDVTYLAINLIKRRLRDAFGEALQFEEKGQPTDFHSAQRLAELDKFQFQHWALSLIDARPLREGDGKGADRGVDGLLYFYESKDERRKIIVQVKGGGVKRGDVATLLGDVNNQKAAGGILLTLEKPTKPMRDEAADAGRYESKLWHDKDYPKIQMLTIEGLLDNTDRVDAPPQMNPFAKAQREAKPEKQADLI
jgi:site-specific DNA-methyltransferase (adenine-specific)